MINEVDDRLFTSEVPVKINFFGKGICALLFHFFCIGTVFTLKNLRLRQSELIYALLHIPYHEEVVFPADGSDKGLLYYVAVLIFVYENMPELVSEKSGCLLILKNLVGSVLYIVEVHQTLFSFKAVVYAAEVFYHAGKIPDIRLGCFNLKPQIFGGIVEAVLLC